MLEVQLNKWIKPLFRSVIHGVFVTDISGNILYWNRRCEEIIGYNKQEILGNPVDVLFDDASNFSIDAVIEKYVSLPYVYEIWNCIHKGRGRVRLKVWVRLMQNLQHQPPFIIFNLIMELITREPFIR